MSFISKTIIIFLFIFLASHQICYAKTLKDAFKTVSGESPLADTANTAGYKPPTSSTLLDNISLIINVFLSLLGIIFLILMIYGGYQWMMDQGSGEKMKKAKSLITAAIIGLIIIFLSYSVSFFVFSKLSSQTINTSTDNSIPK